MAATLGDIIRITDRQELLGQEVLNVYFYRVVSITGLGDDYLAIFAEWFTDNVVDVVRTAQHDDLSHGELFLENLTNGVDIETYATGYPLAGIYTTGECMPPFVSWGFQLIREERNTRNGYKRFAGVPEAGVADGVMTGFTTQMDNIETALALDWTSGMISLAAPVIVRHPITVPLVDPVYSNIGEAQYRSVGSQNTRKLGRGA